MVGRRMTIRRWLLVVAICGLLLFCVIAIPKIMDHRRTIDRLQATRLDAARKLCQATYRNFRGGERGPDEYCEASLKLLECELAECRWRSDRMKAFRDHRRRMREVRLDTGREDYSEDIRQRVKLFEAEAELFVAQEEGIPW